MSDDLHSKLVKRAYDHPGAIRDELLPLLKDEAEAPALKEGAGQARMTPRRLLISSFEINHPEYGVWEAWRGGAVSGGLDPRAHRPA